MKNALNYLKNNALLIGGFIILLIVFIEYLRGLLPDSDAPIKPKSDNKVVDSAIHILDQSFNSLGTFDSDLNPIFKVLENLTKIELVRLHKDFGYRYYNPLTRRYTALQILQGYGLARPLDLNAIYKSELDSSQLLKLSAIYKSKGLAFPYLGN